MKKSFALVLLAVSLISSAGFARPSAAELEKNFYTCIDHDSSWYQRWGYWVASFSQQEAWKICRHYGGDTKMTGCRVNGKWLNAGYYCVYE